MRERIQKNKKETKTGDRQREKDLDRVTQTGKRKSKHKKKIFTCSTVKIGLCRL